MLILKYELENFECSGFPHGFLVIHSVCGCEEKTQDALPDLLCLHSIDNGFEHRRNEPIDVSHNDRKERVTPLAKMVHH